ncbi:aminotransferase class IV [Spirochaeta thermophila]|uniref:aminotransferase class IV n=1 Tax=Winmispira thermophila TaxID=154 RepID=UPI0001F13191|nr:aminotransferase class IV [Spirochaeta thermophila]
MPTHPEGHTPPSEEWSSLQEHPPLLESLRWTPHGGLWLLEEHLARLERSARILRYPFCLSATRKALEDYTSTLAHPAKVRLLLHPDGRLETAHEPLSASAPPLPVPLLLSPEPVDPSWWWLRHKTTFRPFYTRMAEHEGTSYFLYWNTRGCVTETGFANILLEVGGVLFTPPEEDGLLPGVYRAHLLARGKIRVRPLRVEDLAQGRIHLINSVRGFMPARLVNGPVSRPSP